MSPATDQYPSGDEGKSRLRSRQRAAGAWQVIFQASTIIAILALIALLYNIFNNSFGMVAVKSTIAPESLAINGRPLESQTPAELIATMKSNLSAGLIRRYESEKPLAERPKEELLGLVYERVVKLKIVHSWGLTHSILHRSSLQAEIAASEPEARVVPRSWINKMFFTNPQGSRAETAGIRTAILGTLWTIAITIVIAFPIGVGASIYLEEYARPTRFNRMIQTNISNLAGVPSIIYGMLGLALFVRLLEPLTSGALFGVVDPATANGRTILSASLTLALLILPLIIINGQEAIRAVPNSIREASYGMGATKWQTMWFHVLPSAMPGILTGTILAVSRAIGETAPLVVVGASTFVAVDPGGPFDKFTTLPIQIYQWTARPIPEFRNLAAAAILVLMALLLTLNATAIIMRNRYRKQGAV